MSRKNFECDAGSPYHITGRCINKEWFCHPDIAWDIFSEQLWFVSNAYNMKVHSFVMMPNHFHLIASCPESNLSQAMQWFMSQTSRSLTKASNRINETYGERFHRSRIGRYHYYLQCYKYVYYNPKKAGITDKVETYKYSSLRGLLGLDKLKFPIYDSLLMENLSFERTLAWLNENPRSDDWEVIRKASKKSEFQIARTNSRPSDLETHLL